MGFFYGCKLAFAVSFIVLIMMEDSKDKNNFKWDPGASLDDSNFSPVGNVRSAGLPKISKSTAVDPEKRKQERESFLAKEQSQPYKQTIKKLKDDSIIVESSESGLSRDFEDSEMKKLIDQGNKMKGIDRFGKK